MMYYRLFILDKDENLITGVSLRSFSDDEALDWASYVLAPGRIGELWCGTRQVGRAVPADDSPHFHQLRFGGGAPADSGGQAVFMFG